jgi:hypothetical protein
MSINPPRHDAPEDVATQLQGVSSAAQAAW